MKSLRVNDIDMAYEDRGAGVPVLLVHGFPLDHSMWDPVVERLETVCRLIAPDLRGYGRTTLGEIDESVGVPMERYADDLAGLLDGIGVDRPVVYVGFSMGGYVGWQFLRGRRDRVRGLVMCNTRAADDNDEARSMRLRMADHVAEWGAGLVAEAMLPKLFAPASLEDGAPAVEQTRAMIGACDPRAIAAAQRGMAARPDVTAGLGAVDLPAVMIAGAEDQISTPAEMRAMADAMPRGELTIIPGAGHMAPVENPDAVAAALRGFLSRL